jgi:DNA-binding NarL/FixJ family response regulator
MEILTLLGEGLLKKEIADQLDISAKAPDRCRRLFNF